MTADFLAYFRNHAPVLLTENFTSIYRHGDAPSSCLLLDEAQRVLDRAMDDSVQELVRRITTTDTPPIMSTPPSRHSTSPASTPPSDSITSRPSILTAEYVRAILNYAPSAAGGLCFQDGDIITLVEPVYMDRWKGSLNGQVGIFPLSHVERLGETTSRDAEPSDIWSTSQVSPTLSPQGMSESGISTSSLPALYELGETDFQSDPLPLMELDQVAHNHPAESPPRDAVSTTELNWCDELAQNRPTEAPSLDFSAVTELDQLARNHAWRDSGYESAFTEQEEQPHDLKLGPSLDYAMAEKSIYETLDEEWGKYDWARSPEGSGIYT